jgi:hypothetical protein
MWVRVKTVSVSVVVVVVVVLVVVVVVILVCLSDTLFSHRSSRRSEVLTAVISAASIPQICYALSLCRHFDSSGRSQCLMVRNPEDQITMLFRNDVNCRHNDSVTSLKN